MKIKRLCIANGDEYEDVVVSLNMEKLKEAMLEGDVISIPIVKKLAVALEVNVSDLLQDDNSKVIA